VIPKRNTYLLIVPALAVILLDQISKYIVLRTIALHESIPVIGGFFSLVHTRNRGMAFGLMNRPGSDFSFYFLVAATIAAVLLLLFWFTKLKDEERRLIFGLSLILGGAIGNLIDRLRLLEA
jgi:signal peptidase II